MLIGILTAAAASPLAAEPVSETATATTSPLDLAALLAEADDRSPRLLAARARLRAARHLPSQAEALPDPTVSVAYTNTTLSRITLGSDTDADLTLAWTQETPYPGKRRMAGDVARAEIAVREMMLQAARLRVRADVEKAYADLYRLGRIEAILRDSQKLLAAFLGAASARYEAGLGIIENVIRAQTEQTKLEARLIVTEEERRVAEQSLAALLGRSSIEPPSSVLSLPALRVPARASIENVMRDRSPDLNGFAAIARMEGARLSLARRNQKPDFVWEAAYSNRGGLDPMVMGLVGVRLPLYRKQKQAEAVAQSQHDFEAAQMDMKGREVDLLAEVRSLLARAERANSLALVYKEGILPQAQSALDAAASAYAAGQAEFITLIDDFLALLDGQVEYETQRAELVQAIAALEPLTGIALVLPGVMDGSVPSQGGTHE